MEAESKTERHLCYQKNIFKTSVFIVHSEMVLHQRIVDKNGLHSNRTGSSQLVVLSPGRQYDAVDDIRQLHARLPKSVFDTVETRLLIFYFGVVVAQDDPVPSVGIPDSVQVFVQGFGALGDGSQ